MDIDAIKLVGQSTIDLPIRGATPSDAYILKGFDGFGPVEHTVSIFEGAGTRSYGGRRAAQRQMVLLIALNPNYNAGQRAGSLRDEIYKLFQAAGANYATAETRDRVYVQLLKSGSVIAQTPGFLAKVESVPFSENPEIQLTLDSPMSYFEKPTEVLIDNYSSSSSIFVANNGSAYSGFYAEFRFEADVDEFRFGVDNISVGPHIAIDYDFKIGDILELNTNPGEKNVRVLKASDSTYRDLTAEMSQDSEFFKIRPGNNTLHFKTASGIEGTYTTFRYTPKYLGV